MSDVPVSMRQRILDAAFDAFMRHGYGGTSTAQIARLAQVSKRDLYALFGSKQAMLADCVAARAERMRRPLALPPPDDMAGLRATLIAYGTTLLAELGRPEVMATYRLAILEAESAPDVARTLDRQGREGNARATVALLSAARDRGLLDGCAPEDMADLFLGVLMTGGIVVRMLMRVTMPPTEAEAARRAGLAADALIRAYGSAPPSGG
jgi:AcrR family transcriptional regulator